MRPISISHRTLDISTVSDILSTRSWGGERSSRRSPIRRFHATCAFPRGACEAPSAGAWTSSGARPVRAGPSARRGPRDGASAARTKHRRGGPAPHGSGRSGTPNCPRLRGTWEPPGVHASLIHVSVPAPAPRYLAAERKTAGRTRRSTTGRAPGSRVRLGATYGRDGNTAGHGGGRRCTAGCLTGRGRADDTRKASDQAVA